MPRYEVESELGVSLVDAMSGDDAERFMRREYGHANGPYTATEVPAGTKTAGIGLSCFIHQTARHFRAKTRRKTAAPSPTPSEPPSDAR